MYKIGPFQFTYQKTGEILPKKIYGKEEIKIKEKGMVLITGPSGGGKSTLLSLLKGLMPEYIAGNLQGNISYQDSPVNGENFKNNLQKIVYLFQNPFSQSIHEKVSDEFFFAMENFQFSHDEMEKQKEQLSPLFQLNHFWNQKSSEISHGQCQKLTLASLLAIRPQVLLLDEPTAFLDSLARQQFYSLLQSLREKFTIILVDHHLQEIPEVDQVIWISQEGEVTEAKDNNWKNSLSSTKKDIPLFQLPLKKNDNFTLKAESLSFYYQKEKPILKSINLSLKSGEIIVITGQNGEGKSTLFKLLAGLLTPKTGSIQLFSEQKTIPPSKWHLTMGFIFQNPETHFYFETIDQELNYKLPKENELYLKDLIKTLLPDIDLRRSPFMISEGQKRRLSLAMSLVHNKNIIFYDEPTFGQDEINIAIIESLILSLKKANLAQIIITHNLEFARKIAPSIYEIKKGQLELIS